MTQGLVVALRAMTGQDACRGGRMRCGVRSVDGTRLCFERTGRGAPVVLVHGTVSSWTDWAPVIERLSESFDVAALDRRGRGRSDDGRTYSLDLEVADTVAVMTAMGDRCHLVGHSFGAVVALLVASRRPDLVRSLVVYEPPIGDSGQGANTLLDDLDAAVAEGTLDEAVGVFLRATGATEDELAAARGNERGWAGMRDAVSTISREVRAASAALPFAPDVTRSITAPTLVLLGADQDAPTYAGLQQLAEVLPFGELARVPGRHLAMLQAPDAFAAKLSQFFGREH